MSQNGNLVNTVRSCKRVQSVDPVNPSLACPPVPVNVHFSHARPHKQCDVRQCSGTGRCTGPRTEGQWYPPTHGWPTIPYPTSPSLVHHGVSSVSYLPSWTGFYAKVAKVAKVCRTVSTPTSVPRCTVRPVSVWTYCSAH